MFFFCYERHERSTEHVRSFGVVKCRQEPHFLLPQLYGHATDTSLLSLVSCV